jgi:predicted Zn-dependent protease
MTITKDQILTTLDGAIARSPADTTELVVIGLRDVTTRFAENRIHQNLVSSDDRLVVRVSKDGRVAVSATNDLSADGIDRAVADALEIAAFLEPDEGFPGVVKSPKAPEVNAYFAETDQCSPDRRAAAVSKIAALAQKENLQASGLYRLRSNRVAVANSAGTRQFHEGTVAELSVSASDDATLAQGWSMGVARDIDQINPDALGRTAVDKAVRSRNPQAIAPGEYTVILEPAAVGQMLLFLGFLAFSGRSFAMGRGVLSGRIGETVTGANITIHENPFLPAHPGMPFDYEGVPKQKVTLIENGVAKGVVHDRRSAQMAGTESTGHSLPPDNARGPYPKNLVLAAGDASVEEMIASTERGILITHFWYVNYLNPMRAQLTATTRDGTFLIENGAVTKPVQNMRVTPPILESFARAEQIGRARIPYPQYSVVMYVPGMKIAGMQFLEDNA